jgi:6-phosphogluconate dehydrogenase
MSSERSSAKATSSSTVGIRTSVTRNGIAFLDAGTSGGIWGLKEGFCLMVGGDAEAFARIEPVFKTLAPENGYLHVGASGSGHFTKMVHNGIEYGLLQAYGEGFEILRGSKLYPDLDLAAIAELWRHGSVVRSWLLDLAARALSADPHLEQLRGYVADSGEGRWTIAEAIEEDIPAPVIAISLFARFLSRQDDSFAMRMIAALRQEFGGHAVKAEGE